MIITHNLTNKFQPLEISEKYITWMAKVNFKTTQKDEAPPHFNVSRFFSVIKRLHTKFIADLYHHLNADKEIFLSGFK